MYKLFCGLDELTMCCKWSLMHIYIRRQFTLETIMMSMVNSIEQAIRPLFLMWHILGLGVYTSKPYLSTLYNVTMCTYSYLFYYTVFAVKAEKWFLATSTLINNGTNLFVTITSIIMSLRQHKVHIWEVDYQNAFSLKFVFFREWEKKKLCTQEHYSLYRK